MSKRGPRRAGGKEHLPVSDWAVSKRRQTAYFKSDGVPSPIKVSRGSAIKVFDNTTQLTHHATVTKATPSNVMFKYDNFNGGGSVSKSGITRWKLSHVIPQTPPVNYAGADADPEDSVAFVPETDEEDEDSDEELIADPEQDEILEERSAEVRDLQDRAEELEQTVARLREDNDAVKAELHETKARAYAYASISQNTSQVGWKRPIELFKRLSGGAALFVSTNLEALSDDQIKDVLTDPNPSEAALRWSMDLLAQGRKRGADEELEATPAKRGKERA